ncbi:MAG TPA: spore coat protein [Mobilitalea sp.]|nr:spore coat protein [Mobilitalea sp.]
MQEKAMVSDALNTINSGMKTYTDMIAQTENQQLRSALQQMRNEAEQSQYELYTIAKNKNYYQPAQQASQSEINSLKSIFVGSTGWAGNSESIIGNISMTGNTSWPSSTMGSSSDMSDGTSNIGSMPGSSGTSSRS